MEGFQGALQENKPTTLKQGRYIREIGKESRRRIVLYQGLGLYRKGRETYKGLVKIIARERKELKQSIKKRQETIYRNAILVGPMLERCIGVKGTEANLGKRNLSCSIINAIGGKYLRALRRPNKGRKYNGNTFKNRNNRTKRLALLGRRPSKQPKMRIQLAKIDTKTRNTVMPLTHQLRSNALSSQYREL